MQEAISEHIHRYFVAVYGKNYVFRAPETFPNVLERWMLATATSIQNGHDSGVAEECMKLIEKMAKADQERQAKEYYDNRSHH